MRLPFLTCSFLIILASSLAAQTGGEAAEPVLIWTHNSKAVRARHGATLRQAREFRMLPLVAARLTAAEGRALASDPDVEHIQADRKYYTSLLPAIPVAGIPPVWEAGYLGRTESVAFIDTGIQSSHPMFQGVNIESHIFLKSGAADPCFADDANSPEDLQGHGTRTASILAGQGIPQFANYYGAARGVGTLYSMKAGFRSRPNQPGCQSLEGTLYGADIFDALEFIALHTSAKIVNLSVGAPAAGDDDGLARVADYVADAAGLTLVFAAGNAGYDGAINTPGIAYNGITVANLDDRGTEDKSDDIISPSSTRGPTPGLRNKPDLAASGTRVYSADIASGGLSVSTGTSTSAPIVAGAAVLLRDAGVNNPLAVKALLINSTGLQPYGWQRDSGWGLVNASAAFDQRWNLATGAIAPRTSRFYRGSIAGPIRATLAWNRHIDTSSIRALSPLNALSLQIYKRDGSLVTSALGDRDNVISLNIPAAGEYVARIEAPAAAFARELKTEDYAIAWTLAGMSPAANPGLTFRCVHANPVQISSPLTVTCTAENTGEIDIFNVTGTVSPPPGFTNGGPQSFGNLTPGASRSSTWTLGTPSNPNSYDWTATASANAYGLNLHAQAALSQLEVIASASALTLDPAEVFLTAASPLAQIKTGAATIQSATTSAPWIRAAISNNGVAPSLTDRARDLAPGTYSSDFTVATVNGASRRGRASVTVTAPPPVVESARITTGAEVHAGCPAPDSVTALSDSADLQFWFIARNVAVTDIFSVQWISPVGLAENTAVPAVTAAGDYCFAVGLDPTIVDASHRFGTWRADLLWNGTRRASVPFTIFLRQPLAILRGAQKCVSDIRTLRPCVYASEPLDFEFVRPSGEVDGRAQSTAPYEEINYKPNLPSAGEWTVRVYMGRAPRAEFRISVAAPFTASLAQIDDSNTFHYVIDGVESSARGRIEFIDPSGAATSTTLTSSSGAIELPNDPQGRWKLRLYWDEIVVYSATFDRFPVQVLSTAIASGGAGCLAETGTQAVFSTLDRTARFALGIDGATPGDRVVIEFSRQGFVEARAAVGPIPEPASGPWCFIASLPVSGAVGAQRAGDWQVRATWNDIEIARKQFGIRRPTRPESSAAPASYAPLDPATAFAPLALKGEQSRP